jgi:hypothetical protein
MVMIVKEPEKKSLGVISVTRVTFRLTESQKVLFRFGTWPPSNSGALSRAAVGQSLGQPAAVDARVAS